jgi:hypothetical protein
MVDIIKVRRGATATITNAFFKFGTGVVVSDIIDLKDSAGDANDDTNIAYNADASLDSGAVKNTTSGGATITENTSTGADTSVFGWTGYSF